MKICPISSINNPDGRACESEDCMFWNRQCSTCSIAAVTNGMDASADILNLIADSVADVAKHTAPVNGRD